MIWLLTEIWLWVLVAFLVGALVTWAIGGAIGGTVTGAVGRFFGHRPGQGGADSGGRDPASVDTDLVELREQLRDSDRRVTALTADLEEEQRVRTAELSARDREMAVLRARLLTMPPTAGEDAPGQEGGAGEAVEDQNTDYQPEPIEFARTVRLDKSAAAEHNHHGPAGDVTIGGAAAETDDEAGPNDDPDDGDPDPDDGDEPGDGGGEPGDGGEPAVGPGDGGGEPAVGDEPVVEAVNEADASEQPAAVNETDASEQPAAGNVDAMMDDFLNELTDLAGVAAPCADGRAPDGYSIKGRTDEGVYHTPDSPTYASTAAEAWFANEIDAQAAGFVRWDEATPESAATTGPLGQVAAVSSSGGDVDSDWSVPGPPPTAGLRAFQPRAGVTTG